MIDAGRRFDISCAPVGMGKSLCYMLTAAVKGGRTAIVTYSKALQDQLVRDFTSMGLFDMRGLKNYTCEALAKGGHLESMWSAQFGAPTCDAGPCHSGLPCSLRNGGCAYFDAFRRAGSSELVVTNYAYWIAIHRYGQGLGKFDRVILDECQYGNDALVSALTATFSPREFELLRTAPPKAKDDLTAWVQWARQMNSRAMAELEPFENLKRAGNQSDDDGAAMFMFNSDIDDAMELKTWKTLASKTGVVMGIRAEEEDWAIDFSETDGVYTIAPAWIAPYAEKYLFLDTPKVMLVSATVRPKTADLLGIPKFSRDFREYQSTFPVHNRPIFWVPTTRVGHKTAKAGMDMLARRMDQIIGIHLKFGHKGIVHTVSYKLQLFLMSNSRYKDRMILTAPGKTQEALEEFRKSENTILMSPSVGTGYDFPYDDARYQIISKLPFRDHRGPIEKAQSKSDPDYLNYLVAQDLVQMYGRPNRAPDDSSVTWIIDDHIEWFMEEYSDFFSGYFIEAFEKVESLSKAWIPGASTDAQRV